MGTFWEIATLSSPGEEEEEEREEEEEEENAWRLKYAIRSTKLFYTW